VDNQHLASKNQVREFNATVEREKITLYHRHDTVYDNIRGKICSTALELFQIILEKNVEVFFIDFWV